MKYILSIILLVVGCKIEDIDYRDASVLDHQDCYELCIEEYTHDECLGLCGSIVVIQNPPAEKEETNN